MRRNAADRRADLAGRFSHSLTALEFSPSNGWAIAVSGGGDSVALMHLSAEWALRNRTIPPVVLSVDHGLRQNSTPEAQTVAVWANRLGLPATILRWEGPKPRTGLEEKARMARHRLMGEWCITHRVHWLLLGHTLDDQAENFLLRLGRGSGVDGLAGMRACVTLPVPGFHPVKLLRPLLDFGRAELREYLTRLGANWFEDPMNADGNFTRARIRKLIPALAEAGIRADRIVSASRHLARARQALDAGTQSFLTMHAEFGSTGTAVDGASLENLPRELGLRVLCGALLQVGGRRYRPRFDGLERLFDAVASGDFRGQTLAGCCVSRATRARAIFGPKTLWIQAEGPRKSEKRAAGSHRRDTDLTGPASDPNRPP